MVNEGSSKFIHPYQEEGVASHLFHREYLKKVPGHLAEPEEVGLTNEELGEVFGTAMKSVMDEEKALLDTLGVGQVPGLPLTEGTVDKYVDENSVFVTSVENTWDKSAVAYPDAGRAATVREGLVTGDGQVCVDHNIKGIGKTKSVNFTYKRQEIRGGKSGLSKDVATDVKGTLRARKVGVLTPVFLPPIVLDEIIVDGNQVNAVDVSPNDKLLCIQRVWCSDVRVSNLYRNIGSYLTVRDIRLMESDPELTEKIFQGRVNGYLEKARKITHFNSENGTNFHMGCSRRLNGESRYEKYAEAFRGQVIENLQAMLIGGVYHLNCSAQNISIAGELGDWDSCAWDEEGDWVNSDGYRFKGETAEAFRHDAVFKMVKDLYLSQGVMCAVLAKESVSMEMFWQMVREGMPDDHWLKNKSIEDLIEGSMTEKQKENDTYSMRQKNKESVELWNREISQLAAVIRR